jgi:DHA1 family bicyclomycin/chloramphenicol resistance-like MFS transporter
VLSPLLSRHGLHLALGAAGFTLAGWLFWRWEMHYSRQVPACPPEAAALEPTERL